MATGKRLTGPEKVRQLQMVLHAKAKEEPGRRFHALIDKVWREDFLAEAYRRVCRNRGSAGVDGEDFADIESYGVERWLGELARDLRDGTYTPKPVRQVPIPKKQPGRFLQRGHFIQSEYTLFPPSNCPTNQNHLSCQRMGQGSRRSTFASCIDS